MAMLATTLPSTNAGLSKPSSYQTMGRRTHTSKQFRGVSGDLVRLRRVTVQCGGKTAAPDSARQMNDYVVFYTVPCSREAQTDNILSVADAIRVMFIGLLVSMQEKRQKELEKMPIRKLKP
eukprot:2708554-Pyramimonas_sp.AAC.1